MRKVLSLLVAGALVALAGLTGPTLAEANGVRRAPPPCYVAKKKITRYKYKKRVARNCTTTATAPGYYVVRRSAPVVRKPCGAPDGTPCGYARPTGKPYQAPPVTETRGGIQYTGRSCTRNSGAIGAEGYDEDGRLGCWRY